MGKCNSLALIDRPILEATKIDATTPLEVSTDGDVIVVSPIRGKKRQARFKATVEESRRRCAGVFRWRSQPNHRLPK